MLLGHVLTSESPNKVNTEQKYDLFIYIYFPLCGIVPQRCPFTVILMAAVIQADNSVSDSGPVRAECKPLIYKLVPRDKRLVNCGLSEDSLTTLRNFLSSVHTPAFHLSSHN